MASVVINKQNAAKRQLDAAIRMFFAQEDELAIHTIVAASFTVIVDLLKKRGIEFGERELRIGMVEMAKQFSEKTLPESLMKSIESSPYTKQILEELHEAGRSHDGGLDPSQITFPSKKRNSIARKGWSTKFANYLKHADTDAYELLAEHKIRNDWFLFGACYAYQQMMNAVTVEMAIFFAYWAAKEDMAGPPQFQELTHKLTSIEESHRRIFCSNYIQAMKEAGAT